MIFSLVSLVAYDILKITLNARACSLPEILMYSGR
jgi:hypothetical protein